MISDVEEIKKPADLSKGDIWLLGRHRVICGDSLYRGDIHKTYEGRRANLVLTITVPIM